MGCPASVTIGDNLVFSICTHDPDTGVLTDADANPSYRVYEDETATPILTGTMSKLDDDNTTGFYTESIACTAANGFEDGKTYTIYIEATVDSDTGGISYGFKAETDVVTALGTGSTLTALITADIYTYAMSAVEKRSASPPTDVYVVAPYKNMAPVAHGDATSPTITVTDSEGNVLINAAVLVEIGETGRYAYTSTVLRVAGETYTIDVLMTIDGSARVGQAQIVGRNY